MRNPTQSRPCQARPCQTRPHPEGKKAPAMESDPEYEPEPESSEEEVKKSRKRSRTAIETQQLLEEQEAQQHFQERADRQRVETPTGFQALMEKLHRGEKLSPNEKKVVWAGMKREMKATVKRLMKLHAACGGTFLFMYAPPLALANEGSADDPNMFQACRMLKMSTAEGEQNKFLKEDLVQQLEHNFIEYRYAFNSTTEPAASIPFPYPAPAPASSSAAASSSSAPAPAAASSSSAPAPAAASSSSAPAPAAAEATGDDMVNFDDLLEDIGDGNGHNPGEFVFDGLAVIQHDVVADVVASLTPDAAEAVAVPLAEAAAAPLAEAVAVPLAEAAAAPLAEAAVAAGKKAKKVRKATGDRNELTDEECVQVNRIKKLFYDENGKSVMEFPCPKPEWMTYDGYKGATETAVKTRNQPGTSVYKNCTTSLLSFFDKGYYKNYGLTDLNDFVKWFKDGCSTTGPRAEMKEKLGGYLAGRFFPIVTRWLFHYAAKHGGSTGNEDERMERVIKAFKKVVTPPVA